VSPNSVKTLKGLLLYYYMYTNRSRVWILASLLSSATLGKLLTKHVPLMPSSIIWCQPMGGDALRLGR